MASIFELAGNLCLILTKLDLEHGLAQPQLVLCLICLSPPKGSGVGKTLNMRLSIGGHLETEAKHIIDLHPLFIVEAGGIGKL